MSKVQDAYCCIRKRYEDTDYEVADLNNAAGGDVANSDSKVDILMARSRNPSLSLHGIAGAFSGDGAKTVIPATVRGKFSLRCVPDPQNLEWRLRWITGLSQIKIWTILRGRSSRTSNLNSPCWARRTQ